jgi:hypothetical protein
MNNAEIYSNIAKILLDASTYPIKQILNWWHDYNPRQSFLGYCSYTICTQKY